MVGKYCLFISKCKEGEGNKSAYNTIFTQMSTHLWYEEQFNYC